MHQHGQSEIKKIKSVKGEQKSDGHEERDDKEETRDAARRRGIDAELHCIERVSFGAKPRGEAIDDQAKDVKRDKGKTIGDDGVAEGARERGPITETNERNTDDSHAYQLGDSRHCGKDGGIRLIKVFDCAPLLPDLRPCLSRPEQNSQYLLCKLHGG